MKLQTRFVLVYGVGGIIFLYLVALLIFARMEAAMISELRAKFDLDARQRIATVQEYFRDTERFFRFSAELPMFRTMRYYEMTLNSVAVRDQIRYLELYFLELAQRESGLHSIRYIEPDGREILRIENGSIARKLADLSLAPDLVQSLQTPADDYRVVPAIGAGGEAELVWWIPVSAAAESVTGLLVFHLTLDALRDELRQLTKGRNEQICLRDGQGELLFATAQRVCDDTAQNTWKVNAGLGLHGIDWTLQINADPRPLLAEAHRLRWLVFGGILPVLALLSFAVTVLVSRQITRRIQPVVLAAQALGEGNPVAPIVTDAKDEIGVLGREMNRAARLVEDKQKALSESNAELESYSYSIAHDLRAPLRSITSFSQLLHMEAVDRLNEEERDFLQRIVTAGTRMSQLIDDILELSRITRLRIEAEAVDLSSLARAIAGEFSEHEPDRKVDWLIQDGITVYGDPKLLKVLLQNLLGNAWKYSCKKPVARIEFGQVKRDGDQILRVRDNGVGFDMRYAKKLFAPFHRLHNGEEFEGSGVGLATAQRIIKRHAGDIRAESEVGKGTTVYFSLGLTQAA